MQVDDLKPSNGMGNHIFSAVNQRPIGEHHTMCSDYLFFENVSGIVMTTVITPFCTFAMEEVLGNLQDLVKYAQMNGVDFSCIWSFNGSASRYLDVLGRQIQGVILSGGERLDNFFLHFGYT